MKTTTSRNTFYPAAIICFACVLLIKPPVRADSIGKYGAQARRMENPQYAKYVAVRRKRRETARQLRFQRANGMQAVMAESAAGEQFPSGNRYVSLHDSKRDYLRTVTLRPATGSLFPVATCRPSRHSTRIIGYTYHN